MAPDKFPAEYDRLYADIRMRSSVPSGRMDKTKALRAVFDSVTAAMPYSQRRVDITLQEAARNMGLSDFPEDGKIELSTFLRNRSGICRHQALAVAVMLERLVDEGVLRGQVSVDRNTTDRGSHAWARYTTYGGHVKILDVAQGRFGDLSELSKLRGSWEYVRPDDTPQIRQQSSGSSLRKGGQDR